ncbi:hypothetical protein BLNAU_2456 [Blattamonas nauphoetae]|uniref:Uncharacterized protein n=1 Tax=Blattamonas nauphoetae TaxID=2049346 RepID=A0ABQ9YFS6_9EUKA|nr:hypothetical protein BLNAU_2456 [Blattamonas nauphoetae]
MSRRAGQRTLLTNYSRIFPSFRNVPTFDRDCLLKLREGEIIQETDSGSYQMPRFENNYTLQLTLNKTIKAKMLIKVTAAMSSIL